MSTSNDFEENAKNLGTLSKKELIKKPLILSITPNKATIQLLKF